MKKSKIVFSGFMAAILFSAGANAAQIASKDYVDNQNTAQTADIISTVNTTLQDYSTTTDITSTVNQIVADSINDAVEGIQGDLTDMATQTWVGQQGFADAALVDAALAGKADTTDLDAYATTTAVNAALATKANTADLGTLAAKNIAAKADLAADVQTSLGLADTALQSADLNGYATTTSVDTALATKADKATTYTKTEVDTAVGAKADTTAVNTALAAKANTADLGALATKDVALKTDLAADVQTSLGLADTALQSADLNGYATTASVNLKEDAANKSNSIATDTGSITKYTTVSAVETYALPIPSDNCLGAQAQCVLAVNKQDGSVYWEDVAMP